MIPVRPPVAAPPPVPITLPKLLLVEGATPMHFFEAFLQHLGIASEIEIRNYGGINDLTTFLRFLTASGSFRRLVTSLGVVRDAEADAAAAFGSVTAAFAAVGLTSARMPPIRTSVFILPDNRSPGMIETLGMEAVKAEPSLAGAYACVEEFFACLKRTLVDLPDPLPLAKNHAQAYLATRKEVQLYPGLAAYKGSWPWDNPTFDPLKQFLLAL
jgi:hypothetical protein